MAENIVNNPPIHLQANLTKVGDMTVGSRPTRDKSGRPKMCRIVSVDRVHGRVNVTSEQSKSPNKQSVHSPGGETVQLPVEYYGINTTGQVFGKFPYVGVGERVLVEHVNDDASLPVVVNAYPDEGIEKHLTPTEPYEAQTNKDTYFDDFRSQKTVLPSQHVILHTGTGNYEHSLDGYSVVAQLNPGDYENPPWRDDYYTGLPENNKNGVPLNCFVDKSTDRLYPIQNDKAQDWVKIHQSHSDNDHHITKRLVKQNGDTHNFWGSKLFRNNSLTEDASVDNGYRLGTNTGKMSIADFKDKHKIVNYAKSQIGKHPYSTITAGMSIYHPKKYNNKPLETGILTNPNPRSKKYGSGSNHLNFIWSVLSNTGNSVPKKSWSNTFFMANDLTRDKQGHMGDVICFESDNYKKYEHINLKKIKHEIGDTGLSYAQPYILAEDFHGYGTKIIGENKKAGNVVETVVGKVFKHFKWYQKLSFFTVPHNITTGSLFQLGNNNSTRLSITDPNIIGYHHRNTFYLSSTNGSWRVQGHSITIDKNGVKIDGRLMSGRLNTLADKVGKLNRSLNILVHNLNDPHSKLTYQLVCNYLNAVISHNQDWHSINLPNNTPSDKIVQYAKQNLKKHHIKPQVLVYNALQYAGYKVPTSMWTINDMLKSSCLTPVDVTKAARNSIYVVDKNYISMTGILLEKYHGQDTKVIEAGGAKPYVNISTLGQAMNTEDVDDYHFYNPVSSNPQSDLTSILPNDDDTENVDNPVPTPPPATIQVGKYKLSVSEVAQDTDEQNYSDVYSSSASNPSNSASQASFASSSSSYTNPDVNSLENQNQSLSNKYNNLVSTLKSSGILPSDYQ